MNSYDLFHMARITLCLYDAKKMCGEIQFIIDAYHYDERYHIRFGQAQDEYLKLCQTGVMSVPVFNYCIDILSKQPKKVRPNWLKEKNNE